MVTAGVILAPVVYWGAVGAMPAETVIIPLVTPESHTLIPRVSLAARSLGPAVVAMAVGGGAVVLAARRPYRARWWWVIGGTVWFGLVAYFVDYDSPTDAFPALVFVALGLAFLTTTLPRARPIALTGVIIAAGVTVVSLGGVLGDPGGLSATRPLGSLAPIPIPGDGVTPPVRELFWERRVLESCHYRVSVLERRWLEHAGYSERCGRLQASIEHLLGDR